MAWTTCPPSRQPPFFCQEWERRMIFNPLARMKYAITISPGAFVATWRAASRLKPPHNPSGCTFSCIL